MQPVHLPPAPGVHRHRPGVDVPAFRACAIREGVHRQADEPVEVLRFRVIRKRVLRPDGDIRDERVPDRDEETEGATEKGEGRL